MTEHEIEFKDFLQKRRLRLTRSRALILSASFALHEHFDAEQLHDLLKDQSVSLATVYRTLPLLVEAGLVQHAVRSDGRDRYEHILGHPQHVHWLCEKCKAVIETDMSAILPTIQKEAKALNFDTDHITLNISGLCWRCRKDENESQ